MYAASLFVAGLLASFASGSPFTNAKRDTTVTGYISYFDGQSKTYCFNGLSSSTGALTATTAACNDPSQRFIFSIDTSNPNPLKPIYISNSTNYLALSASTQDAANDPNGSTYTLISSELTAYNAPATTTSSGFVESSIWNLTRLYVTDFTFTPTWYSVTEGSVQEQGYCAQLSSDEQTCERFDFEKAVVSKAELPVFSFISLSTSN